MSAWVYGGTGTLYDGISWPTSVDCSASGASTDLQRAWVAVVQSIQQVTGALRPGSCFLLNLSAPPLVQQVLGVPVTPCAGYAAFYGPAGRFESGLRWAPAKWDRWIDRRAGGHLRALQDVHTWLETDTAYIDFSTGDAMGDPNPWPPLLYRRKLALPRHPRDAKDGDVLTWRNTKALDEVESRLGGLVEAIGFRAARIYRDFTMPLTLPG